MALAENPALKSWSRETTPCCGAASRASAASAGVADRPQLRPRRRGDRDGRVGADGGPRLVDHAERLELRDEEDVARRDRHEVLALGLAGAVGPGDVGVD